MPDNRGAVHTRVVRVSDASWDLIEDIGAAYCDLVLCERGSPDAEAAYTRIVMRKYELLQRLHTLELAARIPQQMHMLCSPFPLPPELPARRPAELDDLDRSPYRG